MAVLKLNGAAKLFSEVLKLLQVLYVIPATTATAERSFPALRWLKTYLQNSMSAKWLNYLSILHVHKTLTDELDLNSIAAEFACSGGTSLAAFKYNCMA